jgi:cytochrome c biogenesis protein CcmG/thiol:disulfide interchange protein DsbE
MIHRSIKFIYLLVLLLQVQSQVASAASPPDAISSAVHLLGKAAPSLQATTLDGKPIALSDFRGKVLLVNFWATWCGACRLEMPWLSQLREQYGAQGFEVLGLVTDGACDDKVKQVAEKYGVKYPILRCNHKTAQAYGGLPDLPESFFLDRNGKIVAEMSAADSKAEIEANIQQALRGAAK